MVVAFWCPFSSVGLVSSSNACLVVFVSRSEAYAELLHPWGGVLDATSALRGRCGNEPRYLSVGLVSSLSRVCLVGFASRFEAYAELLNPWRVAAHNESLGFPLTDSARCALPAPPPSAAAVWLFARAPSSTL